MDKLCVPYSDDASIIWKKGDTVIAMSNLLISSDQRASVEYSGTGSVLTMKHAKLEDGGEYTCQAMARSPLELTHIVTVLGMTTFKF